MTLKSSLQCEFLMMPVMFSQQRMSILSLFIILFSFILKYNTSPVDDLPPPLLNPIYVRTDYGQSAAKLLLDESDYELSPTLRSSSPSHLTKEAENEPAKVKPETNYQFRKRKRMEGLIKQGKTAEEAEKIFLQRYSRYQKEWTRTNPEKRKKINQKHTLKFHQKKKRQEFPKRFHSHLRKRLKQGWSEQEAKKDAKMFIEKVRKSNRQSSERYKESKKGKLDKDASQSR